MRTFYFCNCGFYLLLFCLPYSQRSEIGCLPYFRTWYDLSPNLECRSEMCCTRLAENTGRKNYAKKSPSAHHRTNLLGYIFATTAYTDNRKQKLLNSNIFFTCSYNMVNFGPLTAEIHWRVWGTQANFDRFHILASLLHQCRSTEVNKTLQDVWLLLGWYTTLWVKKTRHYNIVHNFAKFDRFSNFFYWQIHY